jgi:beta-lactamase class A
MTLVPMRPAVAVAPLVVGPAPAAGYEPMEVAAVEPLMPEKGEVAPLWAPLDEAVRQVAAEFPGRLSVAAIDLTTNKRYDFRPRDPYLPASTFKLPVTLCTLEAIDRGELSWESTIEYTRDDYEPVGAGGFETAPFGGRYSVRNLVDRSLISSNNVAVKMLARQLTWDGLLACTKRIGGPVTRTPQGSTPVTAGDEAAWWLHLWQIHQQRPDLAEELLRPLRQVAYHGRIQAGTPAPGLVTHKFGTYAGYDHDGAIIWADHPYLLVVMTYGPSQARADEAIEQIAAAAWAAMEKGYGTSG